MDCRDKLPGEILLTPLFPDGRGELIDILLPGLECEIKSYFLPSDLDLRGIKLNKNPVECLKPQKSIDRGGNTPTEPSIDPSQPYPPGGKEWPGGFPPDPMPTPPPIVSDIYSNNNWYLLRCQYTNQFSTFYNWLWCWYGAPPPIHKIKTIEGIYQGSGGSTREGDALYEIDTLRLGKSFQERNWVYAQGFANPVNNTYLRNRSLYFISEDSLPVPVEEIERTMGRLTPFFTSNTRTDFVELTFDEIIAVYFARAICVPIDSSSGALICYPGNYSIGRPQVYYPYSFFIDGLPVDEPLAETPLINDGDNGVKEDCCDCIEAMSALMEAYLEKVEKLIKESEARVTEHINDTAYKQCLFFQEQLKAFDLIDDDRILKRIDQLENNIWTGGNLTPLQIRE